MKANSKYRIIIILIVIASLGVSYAYFGANMINSDETTVVSTGKIDISIDDARLEGRDMAPIYDEDYEMLATHKNFVIRSTSGNLNSCVKIYLNISSIDEELKSEYLKYKLVSPASEKEGNFLNAKSGEKMLLLDKIFIESGKSISYDLYFWLSYQDNVDQSSVLGKSLISNLYVEALDVRSRETCEK